MSALGRSKALHAFWGVLVALAASGAPAVEFSVLGPGGDSVVLRPGETVDLEIGVSNLSETAVHFLSASISGYDESVADFVPGTGRAARSFFVWICLEENDCAGGINQLPYIVDRLDLVEDSLLGSGNRVQFIEAALPIGAETTASGELDQGWDGTQASPDAVVTFRAVGLGTTVLRIGTDYYEDGVIGPPYDGSVRPAEQSATFTIRVVPEPGMAILLGLGLGGLARWR
jgi:hypothetical protein